jgi:hypothetical protein
MDVSFVDEVSLHTSQDSLISQKILRHGTDGFTSPPKESHAVDFYRLKNPSPSDECELANLGSNGKHNNH